MTFLINLGLVLIPFMIWRNIEIRVVQEIAGLGSTLTIGLYALYTGSLKRFRNYWLLLFVGFVLFSMCQAPYFKQFILAVREKQELTLLMRRPISGFWMFNAYFYILVYTLTTIAVASYTFTKRNINVMVKIMAAAGLLMALYIFIQVAELDQWFVQMPAWKDPSVSHMTKPKIGGFLGHPTVVSPFLLMLIPIALYLRKYLWAACMAVAICCTESKVAMGSMAIGIPIYLLLSKRDWFRGIGALLILSIFCCCVYIYHTKPDRDWVNWLSQQSSGRSVAWKGIWEDFTTPPIKGESVKFTVTGYGPGTFEYSHSIRHKNKWQDAHCEPLEALYNFGFIGIAMLFMALKFTIKRLFTLHSRDTDYELILALAASLFCILLTSFGIFPFQIAPTMFYTVVVIGLLNNENLIGGISGNEG